jgi:hypothetical protein
VIGSGVYVYMDRNLLHDFEVRREESITIVI